MEEDQRKKLTVPVKPDTAEYIKDMAALKGLTPGQLIGKFMDKAIEQYKRDGGELDGSGYCEAGTLGDWFQKMDTEENFISWINNSEYGYNLPGVYLDYYEDPENDITPELEQYEELNPGHKAQEAKALLNLFATECDALDIAASTDEKRKEPYKPTWDKLAPGKS